jgi:hypothetical protein
MDGFYHSILKSKKSEFSALLKSDLLPAQFAQITKISFLSGFNKRMTVRFNPLRVGQIKLVWRNA